MTCFKRYQRMQLRVIRFVIMGLMGLTLAPGIAFQSEVFAQASNPQVDLQQLAYQVSVQLHQAGIAMGVPAQTRAVYVPILTQEYLGVFQVSISRGATSYQANQIATQYIQNRVSQLMASAQGTQPRRKSLSERGMLFGTQDWVR